jgi:hypothetical protein
MRFITGREGWRHYDMFSLGLGQPERFSFGVKCWNASCWIVNNFFLKPPMLMKMPTRPAILSARSRRSKWCPGLISAFDGWMVARSLSLPGSTEFRSLRRQIECLSQVAFIRLKNPDTAANVCYRKTNLLLFMVMLKNAGE